jgi:hypothetical protein
VICPNRSWVSITCRLTATRDVVEAIEMIQPLLPPSVGTGALVAAADPWPSKLNQQPKARRRVAPPVEVMPALGALKANQ